MKKLLWLIGGYIAGNTVNSVFNRKKGSKLDKVLKSEEVTKEEKIAFLWSHFMDTQKKLVKKIGKEFDESEHVDAIKQIVNDYTEQGKELLAELKEKGGKQTTVIKKKFQDLYDSKKEELGKMSKKAPEQFESAKENLLASWDDFKSKMKG